MLTALDFPEELRYGAHAVWVRDDGAGSARVGLHAYALGRARGLPIHVRLPRPERRLVRGEVFGHVEFEGATFDLVAPVSGEVLVANPDLRGDPALAFRDPFGQGYLLDLEDVPRAEIAALMDRDQALAHYRTFGPPGPVSADSRIEPGRPWPTSLALRFGELVVAKARLLPPAGNEMFTPDWEPGDRWRVEARVGDRARVFTYEVEGPGRTGGEEVTRVRVVEEPPGEHARVLHFRAEDFTLAAWDLVPARNPWLARRTYNPRGRETWLRTETTAEDAFIFDHPKLPSGLDDQTREIPPAPAPEGDGARPLPAIVSYVKVRGGGTRLEVELRADLPRLEGGTLRLFSLQVWEAGAPWWKEAVRTLEGKELCSAKLVSDRL